MNTGIVVPFYNGHIYLDKLVASVDSASEGLDCTLFIIDNSPLNSLPVTPPAVSNVKVEIVRERPGIGYGKACNAGYELCRQRGFDHVMVVNQDGYLSAGMIRSLLKPFAGDDDILITAPLLKVYGEENVEDFFIKYYVSQNPGIYSDLLNGRPAPWYQMRYVSGACFLIRLRSPRYGYAYLFDPLFHMYHEDEDLCRRIGMVGGKIVLVPQHADFYHQHSHTTDTENMDDIVADKLLSGKIYRIKNPDLNIATGMYGIMVDACTGMWSQLLRGRLRFFWDELWSLAVFLYQSPRVLRRRRQEIALSAGITAKPIRVES